MAPGPELILVGTVHLDPRGPEALEALLLRLPARVFTVEISAFSVRYREAVERAWSRRLAGSLAALPPAARGHAGIRLVRRQIRMPFEWEVTRRVARRLGRPCIPVDSGALSRRELPRWEAELLSPENLAALVTGPDYDLEARIGSHYREALRTLEGGEPPDPAGASGGDPVTGFSGWAERERRVARRIRRILARCGPLVHVGGWEHLRTGAPWPTLARLLADLRPRRILLRDPAAPRELPPPV
ncbi:hypothetical protein G3N55_04770 [Dissulfurirhabdus thermomarina]|uniref:TraB/GumN family protein n=1 Tax=Dissulfurirhabdus thermomarina TaxID=1765737 RepID=A0A6N9TM86_DISTH|nr:hypothetical protein [Dissulfurirhabdus thermomarina]NDY42158.1 hypothetical protein [Dissulfurirhabdus thermomarina]NMX22412.1 hypothetical protein [Dissulfurirhabdus thermomarina]